MRRCRGSSIRHRGISIRPPAADPTTIGTDRATSSGSSHHDSRRRRWGRRSHRCRWRSSGEEHAATRRGRNAGEEHAAALPGHAAPTPWPRPRLRGRVVPEGARGRRCRGGRGRGAMGQRAQGRRRKGEPLRSKAEWRTPQLIDFMRQLFLTNFVN